MTPLQRYQRDLSDPAFAADPVQAETVRLLQSLYEQLCLEHRLQRTVERVHLPEFDYAGTPQTERRSAARRGSKSRSPHGMGSRSAEDLSPEELEDLLKLGGG